MKILSLLIVVLLLCVVVQPAEAGPIRNLIQKIHDRRHGEQEAAPEVEATVMPNAQPATMPPTPGTVQNSAPQSCSGPGCGSQTERRGLFGRRAK